MLDDRRDTSLTPAPGPLVHSIGLDGARPARDVTQDREFHFAPRTLIFLEGQEAGTVFQVVTGVVMLYKLLPDGRRQVVEVLGEGDVFGFSPDPVRNCTAEALSATTCRNFDRLAIDRSPALFNRLSRHLCNQLAALHEHTVLLGRKTAMERIASFLMRCVPGRGGYSCPGPRPGDDGASFRLIMTRQEIADYLGLDDRDRVPIPDQAQDRGRRHHQQSRRDLHPRRLPPVPADRHPSDPRSLVQFPARARPRQSRPLVRLQPAEAGCAYWRRLSRQG